MTSTPHTRPDNLQDALELLRREQPAVIAGGTDFYPSLGDKAPVAPILDITAIKELRHLEVNSDGVEIGALCTWSDIASAELPASLRALQLAALEVGSVQIQNRATIAGNLCNASPAADGMPPLLCCDATVNLASASGNGISIRNVSLTDFVLGNRQTARAENELVVSIKIPASARYGQSHFLKLGARKYLVISIAMVACRLVIEDEKFKQAAIVVGSCSEVATRLAEVEEALIGRPANKQSIETAVPNRLAALSPIDDIRGTADYRLDASVTLVRRCLARCLQPEREVTV